MAGFNSKRFHQVLRFTDFFVKFFQVIMAIAIGAGLLVFLVLIFLPSSWFVFENLSSELTFVSANIAISDFDFSLSLKTLFMVSALLIAVYGVFGYYILHLIHHMIKKTRDHKPFDESVIKHMFRLGYTLMISGVVIPIIDFILVMIIGVAYQLNLTVEFNLQMNLILTGVLVYILANIFEYGAHLQSEVDLTV